MSRSDNVYVLDILESITIIENYIGNKSEFDFTSDMMAQDAVIRRFEVLGKASSKISGTIYHLGQK